MADSINNVEDVILVRELPNKTSISGSDLYLSQTNTQSFKLSHSSLIASIPDNDTIKVDPTTNRLKVEGSILKQAYPVGSIYINAFDDRNPREILGFGIWSRIGEGKVLMGEGVGTDINQTSKSFSIGSSGGEYDTTITEDHIPEHFHYVVGDRTGGLLQDNKATGSISVASNMAYGNADYNLFTSNNPYYGKTSTAGGSGGDNNDITNIQPYTTVYMWKREQEINPDEPINSTPVSNWVVDTDLSDDINNNHQSLVSSRAVKEYVESVNTSIPQVVKRKRVEYSAQKSTTNTTPNYDDTTPTITEGDLLMSTTFQATSTSNKLCVKFEGLISNTRAGRYIVLALFQDTSCVGVGAWLQASSGTNRTNISFEFSPTNTNNTTYTLRWGCSGDTNFINRSHSYDPTFGGSGPKSYLTIEEISGSEYEIYTD